MKSTPIRKRNDDEAHTMTTVCSPYARGLSEKMPKICDPYDNIRD